MLVQAGYRALVTASVGDAIDVAKRHKINAVTLDLSLGKRRGLDMLVWLRSVPEHAKTPVLVLTGSPVLQTDELAVIRRLGAQVFFKPENLQPILEHLAAKLSLN